MSSDSSKRLDAPNAEGVLKSVDVKQGSNTVNKDQALDVVSTEQYLNAINLAHGVKLMWNKILNIDNVEQSLNASNVEQGLNIGKVEQCFN